MRLYGINWEFRILIVLIVWVEYLFDDSFVGLNVVFLFLLFGFELDLVFFLFYFIIWFVGLNFLFWMVYGEDLLMCYLVSLIVFLRYCIVIGNVFLGMDMKG